MWLILAFVALGFLIGNLIGLTAESVVTSILGLLFAFGGGSIIAFLEKLTPDNRRAAAQAILALSVSCLAGLYGGIVVSERQLLSPAVNAASSHAVANPLVDRRSVAERKYLRSWVADSANVIDVQYKMGALTAETAYERLYTLVQRSGEEASQP